MWNESSRRTGFEYQRGVRHNIEARLRFCDKYKPHKVDLWLWWGRQGCLYLSNGYTHSRNEQDKDMHKKKIKMCLLACACGFAPEFHSCSVVCSHRVFLRLCLFWNLCQSMRQRSKSLEKRRVLRAAPVPQLSHGQESKINHTKFWREFGQLVEASEATGRGVFMVSFCNVLRSIRINQCEVVLILELKDKVHFLAWKVPCESFWQNFVSKIRCHCF